VFVHLSVHYPKPEYEQDLVASMHSFAAAVAGAPGLVSADALKDERSGRLVGLALWESRSRWEAGVETMRKAVEDDDFDLWEEREPDVFLLHVV
jgi:heme-degrading monooxygenase HmoA